MKLLTKDSKDYKLFLSTIFSKETPRGLQFNVEDYDLEWERDLEYLKKVIVDKETANAHVRLGNLNISWSEEQIVQLRDRFDKLNKLTEDFYFAYVSTSDFDWEPNERTWPARIYFQIEEKLKDEDFKDPAGGYGLASHV
jgi:hypothetical protein